MSERTKVGNLYTYYNEADMLKSANELEQQGYTVKRFREGFRFCVEVTGYK